MAPSHKVEEVDFFDFDNNSGKESAGKGGDDDFKFD